MGYEIDFLPVGDGERSGEAIALRYGNLFGERNEQKVMVIDGGTKESGGKLVDHIKTYYNTSDVDLVISTHPDIDHCSGLSVVLEKLYVKELWMHLPWKHADEYRELFKSARVSEHSLEKRIVASLQNASDMEEIAVEKGIPIVEPFSDAGISSQDVVVLGPSKSFYATQLANFRSTPEPKAGVSILERMAKTVVEGGTKIAEHLGLETLNDPDDDETTAENNSSVILLLNYRDGEQFFLFCGDAGAPAIREAIICADAVGIDFNLVKFIQVPHHGSRHNVGPSLLGRLVGPKLPEEKKLKWAFVSVAKQDHKHPSKKVTNAFKRRGAQVFEARGSAKLHRKDAPDRPGWTDATPLPFYTEVEE